MTETMTTEESTPMPEPNLKMIWPCINCSDARAMIDFLVGLGFRLQFVTPEEGDTVDHSQLVWPEGGGVMLGSAGRDESEFSERAVGAGSTYVVTDDPKGVLARAESLGARLVRELREEDYGSLGFSIADPEGNLWSFGTYRGEG
jgi:uncharacterized glyoxalase superfamily protein PhnB